MAVTDELKALRNSISGQCVMGEDWELATIDRIISAISLPTENARHAKSLREVAAILATERSQGWANPLVCVLLDAEAALSLPVSNIDIDRTSEPKGHWEDGGKVWVEDHDCSLPVSNTGEWQPIETAPKDGSWIIGYQTHKEVQDTVQLWAWKAFGCRDNIWVNAIDANDCDDQPTHWQPLPEAPNAGL